MVSHHSPLAGQTPQCECGERAIPIYQSDEDQPFLKEAWIVGYRCPVHGPLTHDAIVYERSEVTENEHAPAHAVYVRSSFEHDPEGMVINSIYLIEEDAFTKARELYEAFDEVSVCHTTVRRHPE